MLGHMTRAFGQETKVYKFGQLCIGDMFNTLDARWVKVAEAEAICVMSGIHHLGTIKQFCGSDEVILLWGAILEPR